jgi:hypothetical protein
MIVTSASFRAQNPRGSTDDDRLQSPLRRVAAVLMELR